MQDESDTGATHAADIAATSALPGSRPLPPRAPSGATGKRTVAAGQYPRAAQTPPPTAGRYCGTCGGRLEPGSAFCGQCGTPVSTSGVHSTRMRATTSGSGAYRAGSGDDWDQPDEIDEGALTVADMSMGQVYGAAGYSDHADHAPADDSSRTVRLVVGVLCLIGSFIAAVAAIVLALATFGH